jgi:Zn-dependent protease
MDLLVGLVVLLYSAILHEIAHGFVADHFGDPTARISGRLTLDPRPHIDPLMSIALPLLLIISGSPIIFGAAKPVPVDPFNLRDGRKDLALVSLAGPLTNILIAIAASLIFKILEIIPVLFPSFIGQFLYITVQYNLLLAVFNMIPLPPLDGSKIFAMLMSERQAASYLAIGSMGMFILFFLLLFPIGGFSLAEIIFRLVHFGLSALGF